MKTKQTEYRPSKQAQRDREYCQSKGEGAHTPGPWKITNKRPSPDVVNNNANIENDSGWPIALVYSGTHPQRPVSRANARLIAAAPELLAACKAVVLTWELSFEGQGSGYEGTELESDYKQCKAAIRSAEGSAQ